MRLNPPGSAVDNSSMRPEEPVIAPADHVWRRRVLVGLVFVGAAAVYVGVRSSAPTPFPTFSGACLRLRASGLPITPDDWFCHPAPWTHHASYLASELLIWLTYVLPCAILASTGRRFTALLPMLAAPFFDLSVFDISWHWWGTAFWPGHPVAAIFTTLACLVAPVAAVAFVCRTRRPRSGIDPSMVSVIVAAGVLVIPTIAVSMISRHQELGSQIWIGASWKQLVPIAVFGALLGPNRRWWPWSVAPVAVLLTFGPMIAVWSSTLHYQIWVAFGSVVPIAAVGVTWAAWWPLSVAITKKTRRRKAEDPEHALAVPLEPFAEDVEPVPVATPALRRPSLRRIVVADALAVSLLAVSLIMFRGDPSGAQVSAALPTFLGERARWQDVRVRADLLEAMGVLDRYAATHRGYQGAAAADGKGADPSLAWTDLSGLSGTDSVPSLTMVVAHDGSAARIGALSSSGTAFCIGRDRPGAPLTYAAAAQPQGSAYPPTPQDRALATEKDRLRAAITNCGKSPWSANLLKAPPTGSFCDGLHADDSSYLICRMVQVLGVEIMANKKAA